MSLLKMLNIEIPVLLSLHNGQDFFTEVVYTNLLFNIMIVFLS